MGRHKQSIMILLPSCMNAQHQHSAITRIWRAAVLLVVWTRVKRGRLLGALKNRVRWVHWREKEKKKKTGSLWCTGKQGQVCALENRVSLVHWKTGSGGCMHLKNRVSVVQALDNRVRWVQVDTVHCKPGSGGCIAK